MADPAPLHVLSRRIISAFRALCLGTFLIVGAATLAAKWEPIPADELASEKPVIDPEAGAEILLQEIVINHESVDTFAYKYHVRAKIFSERGIEHFAKIDIPYDNDRTIRYLAARTVNPDGRTLELTKKDFYDREILRDGKDRIKVRSFSPAGLQPGAIVEYTYTEVRNGWRWYVPMYFQGELPARVVRYKFRPVPLFFTTESITARVLAFNLPRPSMKADDEGYYPFEQHNVPATKEEPFSPPRINTQQSLIVCYSFDKGLKPPAYWADQAKELHEKMLKETKASKLVRTTLEGIVAPGDTPDQKLRKIYDFCRIKLLNRGSSAAGFTQAQRENFKPNENATDTLKTGNGTSEDLNVAFVALARAAGLDARYAATGDRSFINFDANLTEPFMASDLIAAVQLDGQWQFFDPGVRYLPYAVPHWRNSETGVLIAAPKDAAFIAISASLPAVSPVKRKGTFSLNADGTLEGDVTIEYGGHQAHARKWELQDKGPAELESYIRDEIRENLKLAELSEIKAENVTDPTEPLKFSFHLRIPEYADRTGSRIFLQPAVFQKNNPARFTETTRRTDLAFDYTRVSSDDIRITPPEGYETEEASAPGSLDLGAIGSYATTLGTSKSTGTLVYRRTFTLKAVNIPVKYYEVVQTLFAGAHTRDAHTVTFKRTSASDSTTTSSPTPAEMPGTK